MLVSRSSLREAMHQLESKNLIERRPGRGTTVTSPSAEVSELLAMTDMDLQIQHVMEMREILEPETTALAATRATPSDLLLLRDVLDAAEEETSYEESMRRDDEFHILLAHAAQNPLLSALGSMTTRWTLPVRSHWHTVDGKRSTALGSHREILNAIEARDPAAAAGAMRRHLATVRGEILKVKKTRERDAE
jgi:GntR family transcriptional repressor for pyruvate dehydrogenase complex